MIYKYRTKEIKCYKCGSDAIADIDIKLLTDPMMYNVHCPKCGLIYMFCSDVDKQEGKIIINEYIQ